MHTHFDEAKFEKDLRHSFEQMKADPEIHDEGSVILDRNREVSIQMGMMVCRELNRGTELGDIMSAGVALFTEFFSNMTQYCDEGLQPQLAGTVISDVIENLSLVIAGEGIEYGTPANMQEVQGGRA